MGTTGKKKKRTSKKNVDRRSTSSHGNKEFETTSLEKQRRMEFGFQKTVTAVMKTDGWMDGWTIFLAIYNVMTPVKPASLKALFSRNAS